MAKIDYEQAAAVYDTARDFTDEYVREWPSALAPYAEHPVGPVLDIGAGTGVWSSRLHRWLAAPVIAIEPAAAMRARAAARPRRGVALIGGAAERLPIRSQSAGAAWFSTVLHHLDLRRCVDELRRVLRPDAPVLIRNTFPDRHYNLTIARCFPEVRRRWETFPTVDDVVEAFGHAGFAFETLRHVPERSQRSLAAFRSEIVAMRHADTLLASLSDEEFALGLSRLDGPVARGESPGDQGLDLLVMRCVERGD